MLEFFDLPQYLIEHGGKSEELQFVCVLDKQIEYSDFMRDVDKTDCYAAVVDLVGLKKDKTEYLLAGKAVVLLGAKCFAPIDFGKRVLYLEGSAMLRKPYSCYVEILKSYPDGTLLCTKALYRDINGVRSIAPGLAKIVENIANLNWDFEAYLRQSILPAHYHPCSFDCTFTEVSPEHKFNYLSDKEYWGKRNKQNVEIEDVSKQKVGFDFDLLNKLNRQNVKLRNNIDVLESRENIREKPKDFLELSEKVKVAETNILSQLNIINSSSKKRYNMDKAMEFLYNQLKKYWRRQPSSESVTGRILFRNVLELVYPEFKTRYENNVSLFDNALDKNNLLEVWYSGQVPSNLSENVFYILIAQNRETIYIAFIDYLLNLKGHLINAYDYARSMDIDVYSMMRFNPYFLSYFDCRLTVEDLDKLTLFYRVDLGTPHLLKYRNAAFVHNIMQDSDYSFVDDNTIVKLSDLKKNVYSGFCVSEKSYSNVKNLGTLVSQKIIHNLRFYIKPDFEQKDLSVPKLGWKEKKIKNAYKYYLPFPHGDDPNKIIEDYINTNLGIVYSFDNVDYIMDFSYVYKEMFIMQKLYDLQEKGVKPVLNPNEVDRCIVGFEALKAEEWNMPNFKLEQKQIDAVKLLYNPIMCVTGPAGSGKTTTAEAMLFGMYSLLDIQEEDIMFCAPTGKAANRLKEVVKKPTRTINSLFGIGNESYELLDESKIKKKSEIKVLVVDESSMINVELMFNMLRKISDGTRIIFIGDKAQLPPIGPGKPFANMLSVLPCVVLDVTKRASANSGITRNAEKIIYHSDDDYPDMLEEFDDFKLIPARESDIQKFLVGMINYHLGGAGPKRTPNSPGGQMVLQSVDVGISPDDIQVITPVNKYQWGTKELNKVLQNVFNPKKKGIESIRFAKDYEMKLNSNGRYYKNITGYIEYRVGDRVIHLENMAMADRFLFRYDNSFEKIESTKGIMNGDIGKIKGFYSGDKLNFIFSNGSPDEETSAMFSKSPDVIYVAVSYEDVDEKSNPITFVIFYKADIVYDLDSDIYYRETGVRTVDSTSLNKLDLAYALTVHKLQGSQAYLTICVLFGVGYADFVSRNLIYTAMTRGIKGVYLVGDVVSSNSIIQRGRRYEQNRLRTTVLDKIYR